MLTIEIRRTNLALGVIACGSAAGGTIFSLVASVTLRSMGFAWSCRLLSLISLVLLSGSCLVSSTDSNGVTCTDRLPVGPTLSHRGGCTRQRLVIGIWCPKEDAIRHISGGSLSSICRRVSPDQLHGGVYSQNWLDRVVSTGERFSWYSSGLRLIGEQYIVTIINAVSIVGRLGGGYLADM